jgi:dihydroorotate dehydrogenase electron transfer subunit
MKPEILDLSTHYPHVVAIDKTINETPSTKTITVKLPLDLEVPNPGQFMMVWVPGSDEIPISVAGFTSGNRELILTIADVGETSRILTKMNKGKKVGIRGPYGRGFDLSTVRNENVLLVAGGCGAPPIAFAADRLKQDNVPITVIVGAKSANDILYTKRFQKIPGELFFTTDDGTKGYHGTASDFVDITMKSKTPGLVLTCGPELMMKKIWITCQQNKVPMQASLERYMKCAIGVCGSCALGEYLVCRDGPVFSGDQLALVQNEWGVFERNSAGAKKML